MWRSSRRATTASDETPATSNATSPAESGARGGPRTAPGERAPAPRTPPAPRRERRTPRRMQRDVVHLREPLLAPVVQGPDPRRHPRATHALVELERGAHRPFVLVRVEAARAHVVRRRRVRGAVVVHPALEDLHARERRDDRREPGPRLGAA